MPEHEAGILLSLLHDARGQPFKMGGMRTGPARNLEGRPLAMYSALILPDRSRLRLLDPRLRLVAAFGKQNRPMSGFNERREPA